MTSSDRFPVPVRSAVKSNLTDWCCQNLSKRALNALTVQASMTELGKLFQIFKKMKHSQYWRAVKFSEFKDIISGNEGKKSSLPIMPVPSVSTCFKENVGSTHRSFTIPVPRQ